MQWYKLASVEDVHKIIKFYRVKKPKQAAKKHEKESETKAAHRHNKE